MRTKDEILKEVGSLAKENPRGGIIPDLADVLMIEVLIDLRDILSKGLDGIRTDISLMIISGLSLRKP
ncbi:hypothetical protein ES702_05019 [subsurface metagenome]